MSSERSLTRTPMTPKAPLASASGVAQLAVSESALIADQQYLELRRRDNWRLLFRPFEQVLVASHDEVSMRGQRKGNEVVVVLISRRGFYRFGVGHLGGASSQCHQVVVQDGPWEPAAQVHSSAHITDFTNEARADHQVEGLLALPFRHDASRWTGADERGNVNVRVDYRAHG